MRGVWGAALAAMGRLRGPRPKPGAVTREELEFSSAFDEFTGSPPPRAAKSLIWLIILSVAGFLLWMFVGEFDVVASASGEIRPVSEVVSVQSRVSGTVVGLSAEENMLVERGDVLIELDGTAAVADLERVLVLEEQARLDVASAEALAALAADPAGPLPSLAAPGRSQASMRTLFPGASPHWSGAKRSWARRCRASRPKSPSPTRPGRPRCARPGTCGAMRAGRGRAPRSTAGLGAIGSGSSWTCAA